MTIGPPIQLFVPTFAIDECLAEIRLCLEKGWTGLGYKTLEFERAWRDHTRLPNAHFLNSATSGLHLALNIFKEVEGWSDGDEVITTPLTFVSSNHAILYERLRPVFADVDQYLCLDPDDIERKITPRTRAVIFVGLGGNTGQLPRVRELCREHNLRLVLDAAHMTGTRLNGVVPTGDATVYSFQAVKPLPTADAGMLCFEQDDLDGIARKKSWLGINRDTFTRSTDNSNYRWMYDVEYVGFKYHGNSIMAAIALVQLRHLEEDTGVRRHVADLYEAFFKPDNRVTSIPTAPGCESARHLFQIEVSNRDELIVKLNEDGIFPGVHYRDNREYRMYAQSIDSCPNSTRMTSRIVSLPMHMRLSNTDVSRVAESVLHHAR